MKTVIINADDFGLNERCSKAIAEAFEKCYVTDTTMMATGEYFDKAATLAKERGFFDKIGIHFNLTEGVPLTYDIKGFEKFVSNGRFNKRYKLTEPLTEGEKSAVYSELCTQIERLENAGIKITHADSHHHIHTGVYIAPVIAELCREHGINKIRLCRDKKSFTSEETAIKNSFSRVLEQYGFVTTESFVYAVDILDSEIPANAEILVHPDYDINGVLIDRRGVKDGIPAGYPLPDFSKKGGIVLKDYAAL